MTKEKCKECVGKVRKEMGRKWGGKTNKDVHKGEKIALVNW
jgi:hypothetical protein